MRMLKLHKRLVLLAAALLTTGSVCSATLTITYQATALTATSSTNQVQVYLTDSATENITGFTLNVQTSDAGWDAKSSATGPDAPMMTSLILDPNGGMFLAAFSNNPGVGTAGKTTSASAGAKALITASNESQIFSNSIVVQNEPFVTLVANVPALLGVITVDGVTNSSSFNPLTGPWSITSITGKAGASSATINGGTTELVTAESSNSLTENSQGPEPSVLGFAAFVVPALLLRRRHSGVR
jgi:hypothetical protein